MKTKQQIVESIYRVLSTEMQHPELDGFHTDANLRDHLALDSSAVLQLMVHLELKHDLSISEEAMMNEDFDTVRAMAKVLYDAQDRSEDDATLEYEEDIKLHCFVSCLSEVLKRRNLDQRALYFGVWDSEICVNADCSVSYHSEDIRHDLFLTWFERLYGIQVSSWYRSDLTQEDNARLLTALVDQRVDTEHIMVMLDMHQLPERTNEFNKDPFPHYLMLGPSADPERWMVYDPDYRWEGLTEKARIRQAMKHPAISGGYIFSEADAREPTVEAIRAYYDEVIILDSNPMTDTLRKVLAAHLEGQDAQGNPLTLEHLSTAFDEVPILAIRKYAYEHGLAFFFRELSTREDEFELEFEDWCNVIAELVKSYKLVQFQAKKLAITGASELSTKLGQLLDEQDAREFRIKRRLHELYTQWKIESENAPTNAAPAEVAS